MLAIKNVNPLLFSIPINPTLNYGAFLPNPEDINLIATLDLTFDKRHMSGVKISVPAILLWVHKIKEPHHSIKYNIYQKLPSKISSTTNQNSL